MKCIIDQRREIEQPYACDPCVGQLDSWLSDLAGWWPRLEDLVERGSGGGPKVAGSREAPLPFNPRVFDMLTPYPFNRDSIQTALSTAIRDWCETFAGSHAMPAQPPQMALWLRNRLDVARRQHPALDEFHGELRALRNAVRHVVGESDAQPEPCPQVPCKSIDCDRKTLVRLNDGSGYVECKTCGRYMTEVEYEAWVKLVLAYAKKEMAA